MPAVLLATLLFSLGLPFTTSAQVSRLQPPDRAGEQVRFRVMDRNNDGIITRDEWRGSEQSFRVHDWNRDGMLSGDEIRVGGRRTDPIDERDFDPTSPDEFIDWTESGFARLDRNRDGRIARNEWLFNREAFIRADRDRNNVLSRAEFLGVEVDDDRNDRFEYLDANNNGRIERDEWHGSIDAFDWLDRDRNGILSRVEVVGEDTTTRTDQFASLDIDRSGTIDLDEWYWSRRSFDQRDVNRDGRITPREFRVTADAAAPLPTPTAPAQAVIVDARQQWTDTGVFVRAGEIITLQAEGTIVMSDPSDTASPAGSHRQRYAKNAPLRDSLAGALLVRVGNSQARFEGDRFSFTAPVSGQLQLGINDDHMADNSGQYRVTIRVDGPTR